MKKMKKTIIYFLMTIFLIGCVDATGVAISPGTIDFGDMVKGGYAEARVRISTTKDIGTFNRRMSPLSETPEWITFAPDEKSFEVEKGYPEYIKIKINVPNDARNGFYENRVSFLMEKEPDEMETGVSLIPSVGVDVNINVTDTQILKCNVNSLSIADAEFKKSLSLSAEIKNTGNVRILPEARIKIWDSNKENIVSEKTVLFDEILATVLSNQKLSVENELDEGQYWADMSVDQCGFSTVSEFDVFGEGALKADGEILRLERMSWMEVGQITPISVYFKNTGEKAYDAVFKGTIESYGEIIQVLESEKLKIDKGDIEIFEMYWTPEKPGRYGVYGSVYYDNKKTSEFNSNINVNSAFDKDLVPEHIRTLLDADVSSGTKDEIERLIDVVESDPDSKLNVFRKIDLNPVEDEDYKSKVTLLFKAEEDMDNVRILEALPKSIVENTDDIKFLESGYTILEKDPIFYWDLGKVKKGEIKKVNYLIKDEVRKIELDVFGVKTGKMSWITAKNLLIAIVVVLAFITFTKKKS